MTKTNLLSISVSLGTYAEFINTIIDAASKRQSQYACVANVHMLVEGHQNKAFGNIVSDADIITPDGKPLVWALNLLKGIKQERVAGMDLLPDLLKEASQRNIAVYFYGGTQVMLDKTSQYLKKHYPHLSIAGSYSPPFRPLSEGEEEAIVNTINQSGAGLVFVILGCPKQERWMACMRGRIQASMIGVGGALPVMLGMQSRAPKWMQQAGLEWFYRLMQEPRRLFKRYAVTNSLFIYLVIKAMLSPQKK